jgi:hypothetical protein
LELGSFLGSFVAALYTSYSINHRLKLSPARAQENPITNCD